MPDDSIFVAFLKALPPLVVSAISSLLSLKLNDWVGITAITYAVLQTFFLLKDRLKKRHHKSKE